MASYSSPYLPKPTFPALSLHVPVSEPVRLSGPVYVLGAEHLSSPETASLPENATDRGWLYHPFTSGSRAGVETTDGGVASYCKGNVCVPWLPATSKQEPVTAASERSGPEYITGGQSSSPEVLSWPLKAKPTGCVYQPS